MSAFTIYFRKERYFSVSQYYGKIFLFSYCRGPHPVRSTTHQKNTGYQTLSLSCTPTVDQTRISILLSAASGNRPPRSANLSQGRSEGSDGSFLQKQLYEILSADRPKTRRFCDLRPKSKCSVRTGAG